MSRLKEESKIDSLLSKNSSTRSTPVMYEIIVHTVDSSDSEDSESSSSVEEVIKRPPPPPLEVVPEETELSQSYSNTSMQQQHRIGNDEVNKFDKASPPVPELV